MKARLAQRPAPAIPAQRQVAISPRVRAPAPPLRVLRVLSGGLAPDLDPGTLLRLQATAGNQAIGELLSGPRLAVQAQAVACPPPPAPAAPAAPHDDPRFQAVAGKIGQEAAKQKDHPPASAKVKEAQGAAQGPTNELTSKAAAAQVDDLSQKKPKGFDKAAFLTAVHAAIEKATPKNMEEVDDFSKSGKAGELKNQVAGKVTENKDAAAKDIRDANAQLPDPGRATAKPVTPMAPETPGPPPANVKAGEAMPPPKPEEQVGLDNTRCETDGKLAEAGVTKAQVDSSNEPQFQDAMAAKSQADRNAATAPQQFRQGEQQQLDTAKAGAGSATVTGLGQLHQARGSSLGHVGTHKDAAKARNEAERARVAQEIEAIYDGTKKEVDDILGGLDKKVADAFDGGEKAAHDAFQNAYNTKKDAYFDKRYGQVGGSLLWIEDKLTSPPPEVNGFIDEAKKLYVSEMEKVIDQVATLVETELNRATDRIQKGRADIKDYAAKQPKDLQKVAQQAAEQVQAKFDQLDQEVTDKSNAVVDDLAQKYVAASKKVDDEANAMKEENKGLLDKAKDAVDAMVETIEKMKAMLADMAARAGDVVDRIIDKPMDFLDHLIAAVKQGFGQFVDNIWSHLKKGLMKWLFGEVAKAGITIPDKFDLKGILMFLAQVLGLTWSNIRSRAAKILGAKVIGLIEKGAAVVQKAIEIYNVIKTEGIAGVWHLIQDKIAEIKAQVMEAVGGMVVEEVVKAGIKWIIGLLNPASAFVKACMAIYDIVMFFVNHGREIIELVNAVIDNLAAIVAGNIGAAANLVEQALSRAVPIAIGFLASLLGLGDLGAKIKAILDKIREPVNMAIDWVLGNVVKPIIDAIKSGMESLFGKKDERSPTERQAALTSAMDEAQGTLNDPNASVTDVQKKLPEIKARHQVKQLELVIDQQQEDTEVVHVVGANSPRVAGLAVVKPVPQVAQRQGDGGGDGDVPPMQTPPQPLSADVEKEVQTLVGEARGKQAAEEAKYKALPAGPRKKKTYAAGDDTESPELPVGFTKSGWGLTTELSRDPSAMYQHLTSFGGLSEAHQAAMNDPELRPLVLPEHVEGESEDDWKERWHSSYDRAVALSQGRPAPFPLPARSGLDKPGVAGIYYSSHAERQIYERTGAQAIGIAGPEPVCGECQGFLSSRARGDGKIIVVADSFGTAMVFLRNGRIETR